MKPYLAAILSGLVVACAASPTPIPSPTPEIIPPTPVLPLPAINLTEIQLDHDLNAIGVPLSWTYIFSATTFSNADGPGNLGFGPRVASFASAEALRADTLARLALMPDIAPAKKASIADTMTRRVTSQVDFTQHDFVAVYMNDGGPPFGQYRYKMVGEVMEFCIDKAPNPSGISGMALQTIVKFYTAPKGLKVKMCGR